MAETATAAVTVAKTPAHSNQGERETQGWLLKWTNYLKGYQRRWFVISNGLLSYYRAEHSGGPKLSIRRRRQHPCPENKVEMAHTCRGTISLQGAFIYTVDSCTFVISNGGTQTFHLRAANEIDRNWWVTELELAKVKAIQATESEDEDVAASGESPREDINAVVRELSARLEDLQSCSEALGKHGTALQRALTDLEQLEEVKMKSKQISERASLFRIASNAMINACSEYLSVAETQGTKLCKMLQHEREQKLRLEEVVEQLAQQHSNLEKAATQHAQRPNAIGSEEEEDENEFFDCVADSANNIGEGTANEHRTQSPSAKDDRFILKIPVSGPRHNESEGSSSETEETDTKQVLVVTSSPGTESQSVSSNAELDGNFGCGFVVAPGGIMKKRRTSVPFKPNYPLNLWSIMKNCIGKDLSKIPMPVNFSEPLSMLQRLVEDYEYADVLDVAAHCTDPYEQLAYVAAFTVSSYATTSDRTGKPFNPLLGETYECDRTSDLGWRAISEQVSHHPPMVAQYCEGKLWTCWQEFTMSSKFRGKYLQVIPLGNAHIEFKESKRVYTWRKVTTTVHNIIVGKLWVDQHGDMEITGQGAAEGIKCHLKYIPYSYFTRDSQRKVKGCVMDPEGSVKYVVTGTWDNKIDIAPVIGITGTPKSGSDSQVFQTGTYKTAWKRRMPPPNSDKFYNFTILACQLNEPEEGVAPTDSRLRPDQRYMENGDWDLANSEKVRLEEKQRATRRQREAEAEKGMASGKPYPSYEPVWFKRQEDRSGNVCHVYKGDYWECKSKQDWSKCPNIF